MKKIITTVDIALTSDYDVPTKYHGAKMLTCQGVICNSDGNLLYVDQDGATQTLKVGEGHGSIFIEGIQQIKSTANGTTVGAVSLLYG